MNIKYSVPFRLWPIQKFHAIDSLYELDKGPKSIITNAKIQLTFSAINSWIQKIHELIMAEWQSVTLIGLQV